MSGVARVAVLASGGGTDFQALVDRLHRPEEQPVRVVRLLAGSPGIGALERAEEAGIPRTAFAPEPGAGPEAEDEGGRSAHERWLASELEAADPDLVVLAGYLRLVPPAVVEAYRGRMINIHPALLPAFGGEGMYGLRVHRAVVESGARVSGPTVHFVNEEYDDGPIIAQWPVPVRARDTPEELAARVLAVEHRLLPAVVRAFAEGAFRLSEDGTCRWDSPWFGGDGFAVVRDGDGGAASGWMPSLEPS